MDNNDNILRICHDVKNPLGIINGLVDLCKLNINDKDNLFKYLDKIDDCCNNIMNLVNDCLDERCIFNYFNLDDLFKDLILDLNIIYKNNINFVLNVNHNIIYSDKAKLFEIFNNILVNCCKYSLNNEDINISIIEEEIDEKHSMFNFIISDNGIGMDEDILNNLFKPFHRCSNDDNGHGLGMSIVKELIDVLNGDISVSSNLGVGSTFIIKLCFQY